MQRAGGRDRAANGSRLPNLGQQVASFRTPEGLSRSLRFQIAGVERPLISVAQLAKTGHRVEFGADEGHIVHVPSGQRFRLQRTGGVYLLRMLVRDAASSGAKPVPGAAGAGPAAPGGDGVARLEGAPRSVSGFSRPSR